MNKVIKMAAAAAAISAFGTMASAVTTVSAGEDIIEQGLLTAPDGTVQFDFVASGDFFIPGFGLSAIGNSGGADINKIMVSFIPELAEPVMLSATGEIGNGQTFGGGLSTGFSVEDGDTFSVLFAVADGESVARNVGVQVAILPEAIAPIPVPAAGGLLLAALAAGGVVARRKKKAD